MTHCFVVFLFATKRPFALSLLFKHYVWRGGDIEHREKKSKKLKHYIHQIFTLTFITPCIFDWFILLPKYIISDIWLIQNTKCNIPFFVANFLLFQKHARGACERRYIQCKRLRFHRLYSFYSFLFLVSSH